MGLAVEVKEIGNKGATPLFVKPGPGLPLCFEKCLCFVHTHQHPVFPMDL